MKHTLKGFGNLKSLPIWLSLMQVGDCWWCTQETIITIQVKVCGIFDPSRISVLIGLQLGSLLVCSINMMGGARGNTHAYTPPRENPSHHLLSARPRNPSYTRGASTPTHDVSTMYVWTPWRHYYNCYCTDWLRWWPRGDDLDGLLPVHRRVTILGCCSNSSSTAQRI
jgi:hypothetical protein